MPTVCIIDTAAYEEKERECFDDYAFSFLFHDILIPFKYFDNEKAGTIFVIPVSSLYWIHSFSSMPPGSGCSLKKASKTSGNG